MFTTRCNLIEKDRLLRRRTLARLFLTYSVLSQGFLYWLSISSNYPYAKWLSIRPSIGYPVWEYLTTDPGPLDDFRAYLFSSENLQIYPTAGGFTLYPLGFFLYQAFSFMNDKLGAAIFIGLALSLLTAALNKFNLSLVERIAILTSYPVVFSVSRGNNEIVLLGLAYLILVGILNQNKPQKLALWIAATMLLEPVPSLFFYRGGTLGDRIRFIIRIGLITIGGIWLCGWIFAPHNPLSYIQHLREFGGPHSTSPYPGSSLFSTSLQSGLRVFHLLFGMKPQEFDLSGQFTLSTNSVIFFCGCVVLLYFGLSTRYQMVDRLILTSSCWLVCYSASFDYRMVWLLVPFILILRFTSGSSSDEVPRWRTFQIAILALVMTPKVTVWWPEEGGHHIGSLLNPLLLISLIVLTAVRGRDEESLFRSEFNPSAEESSELKASNEGN
jgi:hypothetical protein